MYIRLHNYRIAGRSYFRDFCWRSIVFFVGVRTFASVLFLKKISVYLIVTTAVVACTNTHSTKVADCFNLERLAGRWEYIDGNTHQIEEWSVLGDKSLEGHGFVLDETDTTFIEFLSIKEQNNNLTFFARPSWLDADEVVPLKLHAESENELIFVNPANEFPKKIIYRLQSDSLMQVYIEGMGEGKIKSKVYDFIKQQSV